MGVINIMAIDLFLLCLGTIILGAIYHLAYTKYKDNEWRKNNPDEYQWMDKNCLLYTSDAADE